MSYRITTDSTCDMPREFYTEHSIPCVGLGFQINGKEYREGSEDCMPIHDFYEALRGGAQSTTMQVNTYDFIDFVEPYLQAGEDVLHLCFSSGLSGTYESVERGAAELREKYPAIPWSGIIGMRHVLVHDYMKISQSRIWDAVKTDIPVLKKQVQKILEDISEK